ncbi:MAG: class I SAM-dependent methyltransferase [Thermoguttaceae bacterium]
MFTLIDLLRMPWGKARGNSSAKKPKSEVNMGLAALNDCGWFNSASGELAPGFHISPNDTIVDIGAGRGRASFFAARQGAKVIAVDSNSDRLATLRQQSKVLGFRDFQVIDSICDPLPIAEGAVDKVICMEVLEHVADPQRIVSELVRVAKPGGEFLISVPDPVCESVLRHVAPNFYWQPPHHIRVFGRQELVDLLANAGLTVLERHSGSFYHSLYWLLFFAGEAGGSSETDRALKLWSETWQAIMDLPKGERIRRSLDELMPKNQAVVAKKAA